MKDTVVHFNNFIIQGKFTNIYFIFSILCKFFTKLQLSWVSNSCLQCVKLNCITHKNIDFGTKEHCIYVKINLGCTVTVSLSDRNRYKNILNKTYLGICLCMLKEHV